MQQSESPPVTDEDLYSLSYIYRQLCIKSESSESSEPRKEMDKLRGELQLTDERSFVSQPSNANSRAHCAYCKLHLFGYIYKCMMCNGLCHMACCKEGEGEDNIIMCLQCDLKTRQNSIGQEDIKTHKRFLGAHFTGISILRKSSDMSCTIEKIEWKDIIAKYLVSFIEHETKTDFLSFLLNPSNNFYVIRRSNGECLLLPKNDEILNAFNFSIFDFILVNNDEGEGEGEGEGKMVSKFTPIYELINPLPHIIETDTSSKCISEIKHAGMIHAIGELTRKSWELGSASVFTSPPEDLTYETFLKSFNSQ